jgi:Domain of unknown function (DUF4388)
VSLHGKFTSMSMADLIQWARTARRTGTLTLDNDATGEQRKVVLENGSIIACSSNSPREYYGNYLVKLGYCAEEDISKALQIQRETGIMLGALLVMVERITKEQAAATLCEKSLDNICDVFLWKDGSFVYDSAIPPIGKLISIHIDPIQIVVEGVRRAEQWSRLQARIHLDNVFEPGERTLPEDPRWADRKLAEVLLPSIDGRKTVREIVEAFPFSRFKIMSILGVLLEQRVIQSADLTAMGDRHKRLNLKLQEARAASSQGNWVEAMHILEGLASAHPDRKEIGDELAAVVAGFTGAVYETNFSSNDVPVVAIGSDAMARLKLSPEDGFILSRIDGRLTVAEILRISPLKEVDLLRALRRLFEAKVIDFPVRASKTEAGEA